jgi:hypothetical protein
MRDHGQKLVRFDGSQPILHVENMVASLLYALPGRSSRRRKY